MKIYILRHEDRYEDCSFFTPLTNKGLLKSNRLVKILETCNINLIFVSPFIRTLQTIFPYVKKHKILLNIDYSLSEIYHQDIIAKKSIGLMLPDIFLQKYNYNPNYESLINPKEIIYPEKYENVSNRMRKFLKYIILNYFNTNCNILIVTHQSLCRSCLTLNKNSHKELIKNYPLGKLCLIFNDDKWNFEEIN